MQEYVEVEYDFYNYKKKKYKEDKFTVKKCRGCNRIFDECGNAEHYFLDWSNSFGLKKGLCRECKPNKKKKCTQCGETKETTEFYKKTNNKLKSECKKCTIKRSRIDNLKRRKRNEH